MSILVNEHVVNICSKHLVHCLKWITITYFAIKYKNTSLFLLYKQSTDRSSANWSKWPVVVVVDIKSQSGTAYMGRDRCPKKEEFHQIIPLEGESRFPLLPHEVDVHFIEQGHHSKAAVVAHSWQTGRHCWLSLLLVKISERLTDG